MKDNKTLFIIQPQSIVDVITNSSSELFIFRGKEKAIIESMIEDVYPNYLNEYEPLISVRDLNCDELDNLLNWLTGSWIRPAAKHNYRIPGTFTFEELYQESGTSRRGDIEYELKKNYQSPDSEWSYSFVTEENKEWVLDKLDPDHSMFLLYSQHDNPNWDMQEELMNIGERHHLG